MTDQRTLDQTRRYLADIPELYALSGRYILPGTKPPDPDARPGSNSPARPPANLDVIDINDARFKEYEPGDDPADAIQRLGILPHLQLWQMLVFGELSDIGKTPPRCCIDTDDHTVAGECGWLDRWLPETVNLHPDFPAVIRKLHRRLEVACRIPVTPPRICPDCGWEMLGQGDYDNELQRYPWYKCMGCPNTLTTAAELARTEKSAEDFVTLRYAAELLGKPYATLRTWKHRGFIRSIGKDARGNIYSFQAVARVAESMAREEPDSGAPAC